MIWISEGDSRELSFYIGMTITLEGVLFNYRGAGTLMFDGMPKIVSTSGVPAEIAKKTSYEGWSTTNNETKFWDATEILKEIIYRCDMVTMSFT